MDIQENENKPEILPIKDNLELDINENIIKEEKLEPKIIENINSPQLIQDILHLSSHSTQNDYQHQNNLIKSLYSFNDSIIPILDDDFIEDKINYNPKIKFLSMKKKLNSMNFEQINPQNNYLKKKIEQYHDLKKKISEYKTNINEEKNEEEKENNDIDNKNELIKKLFLINHPMINLFKDDIDVIKIKNEIEKQFQEKMKDNSNYKPGPLNPHLIHVVEEQEHESIQQELSVEDDEDDDNNEEMSEHSEESFIDIYEPNEGEQHENEGNNENNANNANNNNLVNQSENNNNNPIPVENNNINQNQPNNYIELPIIGEEINLLLNNINPIPEFAPLIEENNNEVEHEIPEVLAPPINPEPGIIQELAGNLEENNEVENEPNNNIEGNNININELQQEEISNGNNVLDNNQNMEENNENNNE
jgi:hypothetical protein